MHQLHLHSIVPRPTGGNHRNRYDLYQEVTHMPVRQVYVAGKLLYVHRVDILQKRIDETPQYLQFFGSLGWFSLDTMFSTIGLTGVYEVCQYMGYDILTDDGTEFTLDFMSYIKGKIKELRSEYSVVFNCEEIPGEQACVSLLDKDHIYFYDYRQ